MDNSSRQSKGASHPQFSLLAYLAATVAAVAWPRLAPDAGLLTWFGLGTAAVLWVPFALFTLYFFRDPNGEPDFETLQKNWDFFHGTAKALSKKLSVKDYYNPKFLPGAVR